MAISIIISGQTTKRPPTWLYVTLFVMLLIVPYSCSGPSCDSSCATCSGFSNTSCLTCSGSRFYWAANHSCVLSCPDGYYGSSYEHKCKPCDNSCATCSNGSANGCLSCSGSYYFWAANNSCVSSCPSGYSGDSATHKCIAASCHPSCATCSNSSANGCLTCSGSYYYWASNNSCVLSCPDGYYGNSYEHKCKPCDNSCATCNNGSAYGCLSCSGSKYLWPANNSCVSSCPYGYYADNATHKCIKQTCHPSCATCSNSSANGCLTCSGSYYYWAANNSCVLSCPNGYYGNSYEHKCKPCDNSCATCNNGSAYGCLSCSGSYYFWAANNSCVSSCPYGYYADSVTHKCIKLTCHPSCATCSNSSANGCLTCSGSYYYWAANHSCVSKCPVGYYRDSSTHKCVQCHDSCYTCDGPTKKDCLSCWGNRYFVSSNHTCVTSCPFGYYADSATHKCLKLTCDLSCATCSNSSANGCLTCSGSNYYWAANHTCGPTCPAGYYKDSDSHVCKPCNSSCATCNNGSAAGCLTCPSSSYYLAANYTCWNPCPVGYFGNNSTRTCVQCHQSCYTCNGPSKKNCLSCSGSNYFWPANNSCVSSCPYGYYADNATHKCIKLTCHPSCATCSNSSATGCLTCSGSYYYWAANHSCVNKCPVNCYGDSSTHTCVQCHSSCNTCSGPLNTQCLSCSGFKYLLLSNHSCVSSCPSGYSGNSSTHTCVANGCHPTCRTCFGSASNQCVTCADATPILKGTSCYAQCQGTWVGSLYVCQKCDVSCQGCVGTAFHCLQCASGYTRTGAGICVHQRLVRLRE